MILEIVVGILIAYAILHFWPILSSWVINTLFVIIASLFVFGISAVISWMTVAQLARIDGHDPAGVTVLCGIGGVIGFWLYQWIQAVRERHQRREELRQALEEESHG